MNVSLTHRISYFNGSNQNYKRRNEPSFTSNFDTIGKQRKHFTFFFRYDLQWKQFAKYLNKHFNDADKVNIYNLACSDGTESYTLLMSLFSKLGKNKSKKFLPIKSSDKNSNLITTAKSGDIPLLPGLHKFYDYYRLKTGTFFDKTKLYKVIKQDGKTIVKMDDVCKKNIHFKTADLFDEVDKLKGENDAVLCRNVWMYLSEKEQEMLAHKLGLKLKKNSLVVLGEYDISASNAVELLNKAGFEETYIDNVFEKV